MHPRILVGVVLLPACTSSPPPHDVPIANPPKHVTAIASSVSNSASPNPPPPVASASVAPALEPPNPDKVLPLDNGMEVIIELESEPTSGPPEIALELRRDDKTIVRREGWDSVTHFDLKKLHGCETWHTRIMRENIGTQDAIRVSLVCRTGEDYLTSSEIALLVKPENLEPIWTGLADRLENTMDSCIQARHVSFRIIPPKTLEKTILEETTWVDQIMSDEVKTRLKRECKVGSKRRIERNTLP